MADPVGVPHRDARTTFRPETGEDVFVDLRAPSRLDVHIDIGQRTAQRREEPFHHEVVPDRINPRDAQQLVDQTPGTRAACGYPNSHVLDEVDDLGDREEVPGESQTTDDLQFMVQALGCDPRARMDPLEAPLTTLTQQLLRLTGLGFQLLG